MRQLYLKSVQDLPSEVPDKAQACCSTKEDSIQSPLQGYAREKEQVEVCNGFPGKCYHIEGMEEG